MSESSIDKIRERIAKLKEKSSDIAGRMKIEEKQPYAAAPAGRESAAPALQKTLHLEARIKDLEEENELLESRLKEMSAKCSRLKETLSELENEKKELTASQDEIIEKIEKQERETWIRYSLGIMQEYVGELFRYLRHTSSMAREAIDLCLNDPKVDDLIKKKIEVINEMYSKTLQLVEQSRIRFTFPELRRNDVKINETINNVVSRLSANAQGKINFNVKCAPDIKITADAALFEEMFTYILQNSVEAIESSGSIDINVNAKDESKVIEISDTGIGIPPHLINKVFSPFFTTKNEGGSIGHPGLGLTRVYWICQMHGGEIEVESQLRKGTKIIITLPGGDNNATA